MSREHGARLTHRNLRRRALRTRARALADEQEAWSLEVATAELMRQAAHLLQKSTHPAELERSLRWALWLHCCHPKIDLDREFAKAYDKLAALQTSLGTCARQLAEQPCFLEDQCGDIFGFGVLELVSRLAALTAKLDASVPEAQALYHERCRATGRPHQEGLDHLIQYLAQIYYEHTAIAPIRADSVGRRHLDQGFVDLLRSTWRVLPQGTDWRSASMEAFVKRAKGNAAALAAKMVVSR